MIQILPDSIEWTALAEYEDKAYEKVSLFAPENSNKLALLSMFEQAHPDAKFCDCSIKRKDYIAPIIKDSFASSFFKDLRPDRILNQEPK